MLGMLLLTAATAIEIVAGPLARNNQEPLFIRIYNLAGAPPETVSESAAEAARILASAGVKMTWETGRAGDQEAHTLDQTSKDSRRAFDRRSHLAIRLVSGVPGSVYPGALGFALPEAAFGPHASVFYDRVDRWASWTSVERSTLLGAAMAHEIGHVLLDSAEHGNAGLMKARWSPSDLRAAVHGNLEFTADQARGIREGASRRGRQGLVAAARTNSPFGTPRADVTRTVANSDPVALGSPDLTGWMDSYQLAEGLLEQGRTPEAIRLLNFALQLRPDSAVVLDALGRAELRSGRHRSAKYYLEKASRLNPRSDFTTINLAQACFNLGEYAAAEQLVRQALGHSLDNANAWRLLGQILCQERRYRDAETAFRKSLSIKDDPSVWNDLGVLYQKEGRKAQALEVLRKTVLAMTPGQARARVRANLALLQWDVGARAEGEAGLRAALDEMTTAVGANHPDTGWILESYAKVLHKTGRKAESKIARDRANEIRAAFRGEDNRDGFTVDRAEGSRTGIAFH